jgi:hypothetical protein
MEVSPALSLFLSDLGAHEPFGFLYDHATGNIPEPLPVSSG